MKNEIVTKMSPEGLEIANNYLELGNIQAVCARMRLDENTVQDYLGKREIKAYIDQVYLDTGYRNRFKLANTLDDIIDRKLEEAEEIHSCWRRSPHPRCASRHAAIALPESAAAAHLSCAGSPWALALA